jgi:hypothetical protein
MHITLWTHEYAHSSLDALSSHIIAEFIILAIHISAKKRNNYRYFIYIDLKYPTEVHLIPAFHALFDGFP